MDMRCNKRHTLTATGKAFGLSTERIRQIEARCLREIKKSVHKTSVHIASILKSDILLEGSFWHGILLNHVTEVPRPTLQEEAVFVVLFLAELRA